MNDPAKTRECGASEHSSDLECSLAPASFEAECRIWTIFYVHSVVQNLAKMIVGDKKTVKIKQTEETPENCAE